MPQKRPADNQHRVGFADSSGGASEVSSIDLGLSVPGDHLAAIHSSTRVDSQKTSNQLLKPYTSKERLAEPFSSGYTKWKAAWRLQAIIVGLYILGKCNPVSFSALKLCLPYYTSPYLCDCAPPVLYISGRSRTDIRYLNTREENNDPTRLRHNHITSTHRSVPSRLGWKHRTLLHATSVGNSEKTGAQSKIFPSHNQDCSR